MTTAPQWSPVDDTTADLLTLVADVSQRDLEWQTYVAALRAACDADGLIRPNRLRPMVRGKIAPRRISAFANAARALGLVEDSGEWQVSDDTTGRNSGKPARVLRWVGAA